KASKPPSAITCCCRFIRKNNLFDPFPYERGFDDGRIELRRIDAQGHAVIPLERVPSLGLFAHCVGDLIDVVMPDPEALLRVNLDRGAVRADASDGRLSFFR